MKAIVADASSLIALSENCLIWMLEKFETPMLVPPYVKKEVFDKPIFNQKYGLEAMRTGLLFGKKIKVVETDPELRDEIVNLSNKLYTIKGRPVEIIQKGEADAIALLKKHEGALLVDEKNTRLLIESRETLRRIMENRIHKKVEIDKQIEQKISKILDGIKVIRSADLVSAIVAKDLVKWPYDKREVLKNMLFALKFSGCSISETEIFEYLNLFR